MDYGTDRFLFNNPIMEENKIIRDWNEIKSFNVETDEFKTRRIDRKSEGIFLQGFIIFLLHASGFNIIILFNVRSSVYVYQRVPRELKKFMNF